jgi:hypothetical protein
MSLLSKAIQVNVCKPKKSEEDKFTHDRWHRASPALEGDSQIGIMIFIGVGKDLGFTKKAISDFLSIEASEFEYKLQKYREGIARVDSKIFTKARLVRNFFDLAIK